MSQTVPPTSPSLVFTSPGQVELLDREIPSQGESEVLIETECSLVSPGTELACLGGREAWAPLPYVPGYGSVGRVRVVGAKVESASPGQRVFTYGKHARHSLTEHLIIPLPETADPARAVFARMAGVSITALRVSAVELGDTVAVFGLGIVGNLAAQLFQLAGCTVIGIDPAPRRRELAAACGIPHLLEPGTGLLDEVAKITGGGLCECVVEATGVPAVAESAIPLAGKKGELILLGSPRGGYQAALAPFLNHVHLWDHGCVTIKGAHEWRYPVRDTADGHTRHSIERNIRQILRLIEENKLVIGPLMTHRVSPVECQAVYEGLQKQKDTYLGVVFDWRT